MTIQQFAHALDAWVMEHRQRLFRTWGNPMLVRVGGQLHRPTGEITIDDQDRVIVHCEEESCHERT